MPCMKCTSATVYSEPFGIVTGASMPDMPAIPAMPVSGFCAPAAAESAEPFGEQAIANGSSSAAADRMRILGVFTTCVSRVWRRGMRAIGYLRLSPNATGRCHPAESYAGRQFDVRPRKTNRAPQPGSRCAAVPEEPLLEREARRELQVAALGGRTLDDL